MLWSWLINYNGGVRDVSSFLAPFSGNARSYLDRAQVDHDCSYTAPMNYIFNISSINCDSNVSFLDM